jgi:hypothetical protein
MHPACGSSVDDVGGMVRRGLKVGKSCRMSETPMPNGLGCGAIASGLRPMERKGLSMEISISEEVQAQLDQVKEWMESKIGREVTYNEVILQILKNFQSVLYPEDLGRG